MTDESFKGGPGLEELKKEMTGKGFTYVGREFSLAGKDIKTPMQTEGREIEVFLADEEERDPGLPPPSGDWYHIFKKEKSAE